MFPHLRRHFLLLLLSGLATNDALAESAARNRWPGRQPDGSVLLPNLWSLKPAGTQVDLTDFPVNIAVHPAGTFAAILHAGNSAHEIHIVDIKKAATVQRVKIEEAFYGLEFAHSGKKLYASGAGSEVIRYFEFDSATGTLGQEQRLVLRDAKERGIPAGLALSSDAQSLYVANVLGQKVAKVTLTEEYAPVIEIAVAENVVTKAASPPLTLGKPPRPRTRPPLPNGKKRPSTRPIQRLPTRTPAAWTRTANDSMSASGLVERLP